MSLVLKLVVDFEVQGALDSRTGRDHKGGTDGDGGQPGTPHMRGDERDPSRDSLLETCDATKSFGRENARQHLLHSPPAHLSSPRPTSLNTPLAKLADSPS